MGQYHIIINLDKHQYLHPQNCGDGMKMAEFGDSSEGTLSALTMLLACNDGQGGGDYCIPDPLTGSWAGDRIVIAGDYTDPARFIVDKDGNPDPKIAELAFKKNFSLADVSIYSLAQALFENISDRVIGAFKTHREDHSLASINLNEKGWRTRK